MGFSSFLFIQRMNVFLSLSPWIGKVFFCIDLLTRAGGKYGNIREEEGKTRLSPPTFSSFLSRPNDDALYNNNNDAAELEHIAPKTRGPISDICSFVLSFPYTPVKEEPTRKCLGAEAELGSGRQGWRRWWNEHNNAKKKKYYYRKNTGREKRRRERKKERKCK